MTLSPDADKAQVRQAVIELQTALDLTLDAMALMKGRLEALEEKQEEDERRIELLSNALKSTLTSAPKPEPRPQWSAEPTVAPRDWRPVAEGDKYWMPPQGSMVPIDQVPQEALERFQREKGTPRPEYEPEA